MVKIVHRQAKQVIDEAIKEDSLFIFEEYLTKLPWDYHDTVMFIYTNGIDQNKDKHCLIFDDDETEKFFNVLNKKQIKIMVLTKKEINGKTLVWDLLLTKEIVEGHKDPKSLFIGGKNLRKFCDKNNLWYKTAYTPEGNLISGSALRFLKKPGEDCSKPENEKPNRIENE